MVKQLYYSEKHRNIYLSKLYTGKYSEVNDVIKYTSKTRRLLTAGALLIISRSAIGCFVT